MKFARGKRIGKRSRDNSKTVMNNQQSSKNSGYFYKISVEIRKVKLLKDKTLNGILQLTL